MHLTVLMDRKIKPAPPTHLLINVICALDIRIYTFFKTAAFCCEDEKPRKRVFHHHCMIGSRWNFSHLNDINTSYETVKKGVYHFVGAEHLQQPSHSDSILNLIHLFILTCLLQHLIAPVTQNTRKSKSSGLKIMGLGCEQTRKLFIKRSALRNLGVKEVPSKSG